ncbi:MAG: FkbM family methyltransferase [Pirellulales bacterium]|nr:FkbM family methyltransferase [Pirellulales bacterium]
MSRVSLIRRRSAPSAEQWGYDVYDLRLPADGVIQFAKLRRQHDRTPPITQADVDGLRRFIRPGDMALDIGARCGDAAVAMALAAGADGLVVALEPNPYVFSVLRRNASLNPGRVRIAPFCFAPAETDGAFVFQYGDPSCCPGGSPARRRWNPLRRKYPLTVLGRNLLEFIRNDCAAWVSKLSFIKVDAAGADQAILKSILPILRETRPVIRVEVFRRLSTSDRHALFDLLIGNGYALFRYEGATAPQGREIDRRRMTAEKHIDILALPRQQPAVRAA